jgi:TP901 family phage tail tape measure protein
MADETIFELNGDATKSVEAIDSIISALDKLKQAFDGLSNSFNVFDKLDTAIITVFDSIGDLNKEITGVADSFAKVGQASADTVQAVQAISEAEKAVADASKAVVESVTQAATALNEDADAAKTAADANQQAATAMTETADASQKAADAIKAEADAAASISEVGQQIGAMNKELLDGAVKADTMLKSVNKLVDSLLELSDEADKAAGTIKSAGEATGKFNDDIKLTEEITSAAGDRIKTLADSVTMLDDAFKIAGDSVANFAKAADAGVAAEEKLATSAKATAVSMMEAAKAQMAAATTAKEASSIFSADAVNLMILQTMVGNAAKSFLQMGIDAQTSMSQLTGLADQSLALAENQGKLNDVIKQTEAAAAKYGVTMKDASDALYFVASAGFDTTDALKIMNSVMEASAATGAKSEEVGIALTSILKSYNKNASEAGKITDEMTQAVVQGNQTFGQFANVIGGVASEAARAGVSFEEAAAAESAMSIIQPRVRQDGQNLIHLFQNLHDKMGDIADAAKSMGKSFNENAFQSMNLIDKLKYLRDIAGGDTTVAFRELTGDVTGTKTAYMLLHDGTEQYNKVLAAENNALGSTDKALAEHEKTIAGAAERIKAAASIISYEIVRMASPIIAPILQKISDALDNMSQHMDKARPIIAAFAGALAAIMAGSGIALIGFLLTLLGPIAPIAVAFGLVSGASVALVDAFKNIYTEGSKVPPLVLILHKYFADFGHWAKNELPTPWQEAEAKIKDFIDFIKQSVPDMLAVVKQTFEQQLKIIFGMIRGIVTDELQKLGMKFADFTPMLEAKIVSGLNKLNDVLSHLSDAFAKVLNIFDALKGPVAAIGGALLALKVQTLVTAIAADGFWSVLMKLVPALAPVVAGIGEFAASFVALANPISLAVIAIGAIIGYGIHLLEVTGKLDNILRNLGGFVKQLFDVFKDRIEEVWKKLQTELGPELEKLKEALGPLGEAFNQLAMLLAQLPFAALLAVILLLIAAIEIIVGLIKIFIDLIKGIVKMVTEGVNALKALWRVLVDLFHLDFAQAGKDFGDYAHHVVEAVKGMWQFVPDAWNDGSQTVKHINKDFSNSILHDYNDMSDKAVGHSIIPDMIKKIGAEFGKLTQLVTGPIKDFCDKVLGFFKDLADKLVGHSIVPDMMNSIKTVFTDGSKDIQKEVEDLVKGIEKFFTDLGKKVPQFFSDMWKNLVQSVSDGAKKVEDGVVIFVSKITDKMKELGQKAVGWGKDFMNGLSSGIMSAAGNVLTGVLAIASQISSMLHFSRPDVGPLADYESWMPDFGTGLAQGLMNQTGKVRSAAQQVAQAITTSMPTTQSLGGFTSSSQPANDAVLAVLKDIHATLKQNGTQQGGAGRNLTSAQIATVQQQYFVSAMQGSGNINNLYTQLNQLMGLSAEYSGRGSATGLGW